MGPDEARRVEALLRKLGIQGVVAPIDPDNATGEWRVYDTADPHARTDMTAAALAAVAGRLPEDDPPPSGPTRGFVVPPKE
ncbi:hypothetical protein JJV70_02515 [Streptomyces sp. JJ66]|uniref:hypothetical protein n=1 Tax=Streptomyces sp. JJ66 TaxID=2803843 RepID=UPI001C574C01|nr:hypothetical protein [Streptomyces sp. JJ66]MBW1600995.1 hypothetical protein [Streptomyces sp. JJ66]